MFLGVVQAGSALLRCVLCVFGQAPPLDAQASWKNREQGRYSGVVGQGGCGDWNGRFPKAGKAAIPVAAVILVARIS